jgi:hypothetical protein
VTAHSGRGQGDQPLYEGVVLPANGDPWTPEQQRQVDRSHGQPPAGQPWGEPWGPDSQAAVTSGEPAAAWGPDSQAALTSGEHSAPPLPPPQMPPVPHEQPPVIPSQHRSMPGVLPGALPGNAEEAGAAPGGRFGGGDPAPPPVLPSPDLPPASVQPASVQPFPPADAALPPPQVPQGPQIPQAPQAPEPPGGQAFYGSAQSPQPQQPPVGQPFGPGGDATQLLSPQTQMPSPQQGVSAPVSAPLPTAMSTSDATQYIPPVTDGPPQHGQYPSGQYQPGQYPSAPPQPGQYQSAQTLPVADAEATQMLPPQAGQAAVHDPESTAQLRTPLPPEAPAGGQGVPAQQPQPPAGFESLFRSETPSAPGAAPDGSGEPGSTQSLPLFDHAVARQRSRGVGDLGRAGGPGGPAGPYGQGPGGGQGTQPGQTGQWEAQGRAARRNAERSKLSRMSPAILIGIGVAVVAAVGVIAGAALSGGDGDDAKPKNKSSGAPAGEKSAGPDPVEAQAKELDKLLADSNNSRATVIRSVENIKSCKKLGPSARDLRAAAGERNSMVTRLGKLTTDKIPANAELKSSLTRAWKASASADSHYAAWADQTAGKKGCHKGKARMTPHVGQGARASGEATAAKKQAAGLWNPTAKKYGLKQRQVGEL